MGTEKLGTTIRAFRAQRYGYSVYTMRATCTKGQERWTHKETDAVEGNKKKTDGEAEAPPSVDLLSDQELAQPKNTY